MALFIEAVGTSGVVQRAPINGRKVQLTARPGLTYRIVDEAGANPGLSLTVKRVDNDLLIEGLPSDGTVQVNRFFANCTPENTCALSVDGIGGAADATITQLSEPIAALADGSFVLQAPSSLAPVIPTAPESEFSFKPLLLGAGALALVGAGGGGGGGGGSTPTAPQAPGAVQVSSAAVTKDTTPVISGTTEAGATVTLTLNLASPVSYQTTADANGNWSIDLGTATPRTGSLPAGGLPADGDVSYLVVATNSAGVGPSSAFTLTIDNTPPATTVVIAAATDDAAPAVGALATGAVTNDSSPTLEGTLSAPLATTSGGSESIQILRDGVVVGTIAAPLAGTNWTYTDTGAPDGAHQYTARVVDGVGNAGAESAAFALTIDTTPPTQTATIVSINDDTAPVLGAVANGGTTNDTSPTLAGTLSAALDAGDQLHVFRDGVDIGVATVTGTSWTFSDIGLIDATDYRYTAAVVDPAGNAGAASTDYAMRVETLNPTLAISGAGATATNAPVTFTFTFSRPVTGFEVGDVVVTGGTPGALTGSGNTYQLVVTPAADSTAPITVNVAAGVATDAAGNPNDAAAPATQPVDTLGPSVTISDGTAATVTNAPVTFAFHFDEPATGFSASDVVVTGGTAGAFNAVDAANYTLVVTPTAGATGNISVGVNAGAAADALGNPSHAATPATQAFDTQAPTITITDNVAGATASGPVQFTFTFSEAVSGFTASDVQVSGGTAGALTVVNPTTYRMTVTPPTDTTGTLSVSVPGNAATDSAGNGNSAAGPATQAFDTNLPPTLVITDGTPAATTNAPVTFTFTFNEPVFGFSVGDIAVTGGSKGALNGADGSTTYTLVVTPNANSVTPITVDVPANVANDSGGAGNLAATQATQGIDTKAPTLTGITDDIGAATTAGPITFNFQFDESVTGFDATDVTISAGTKGAFTGSGAFYQLVVNAPANSTGTITASVANGAASDAVGNPSVTTAAPASQDFDTIHPTLTISDDQPGTVAAGGTVVYSFQFSEGVTGFAANDVAVNNGIKGAFNAIDAQHYTLAVTPTANSSGNILVSVNAGAAFDAANNPNVAAGPATQAYDTRTVSIAEILDDVAPDTTAAASGASRNDPTPLIRATITGTLGGGESVHIFSSANGDLGAATQNGSFWESSDNLAAQSNIPITYTAQIVGAPVSITSGNFLYTYDPGGF